MNKPADSIRPDQERKVLFLQGNEACAEGALLAGLKFFAGYPITPSTEVMEIFSRKMPVLGGRFIQMEDEIAAMGACIGASLTGFKTMTASSGPGISLKQENLGYAILCEVPLVIVNVQRGGPSTGLPTQVAQADVMQARWGTHGDHPIIVLAPSSVSESLHLTIKAFNLAERLMTPVMVLSDEVIGHMREKIEIPFKRDLEIWDRKKTTALPQDYRPFAAGDDDVPALAPFGTGYRYNVTGLIHDTAGFPTTVPAEIKDLLDRIHRKIERNRDLIIDNEFYGDAAAGIGLVSYGSSSRAVKKAVQLLADRGIGTAAMLIRTLWPLPDREITSFSRGKRNLFVVEMNRGQYIDAVKSASESPARVSGIFRYDGEFITAEEIVEAVVAAAGRNPVVPGSRGQDK